MKWSKVVLEAAIISILSFLVIVLLSQYINRTLITAIPIVVASFLGTIVGNITIYKNKSKTKKKK